MVQEGRGHAAIDVRPSAKPFCGRISCLRSGRSSRSSRSGLLDAGGRSPARRAASSNPRESCGATLSSEAAARVSCDDSAWHAERLLAAESRRSCVTRREEPTSRNGWLASSRSSGAPVPARSCPGKAWHGPPRTGDGQTLEPEQIARRLPVDSRTTRRCASAMKPSIKRCSSRSRRLRRDLTACLRTGRVADAEGAHARARQGLHPPYHDQPTSGGGSRSRGRATGKETLSGSWVRRSAPWWTARRASLCCYTCRAWRAMATRSRSRTARTPVMTRRRYVTPSRARS